MALLFICIAVQLLLLCPSTTNAAENDSCIRTYAELRTALHDNETNNIPALLNAFYPPNSQKIQVAEIMYCIGDNKTFCSDEQFDEERTRRFTFKWTASALLFLQEYELINALVFNLFQFNYTNITFTISPPFCEDVSEDEIIDNLRLLTTWLEYYADRSHGNSVNDLLQGYAVHLNDEENTFDITVYGKIEKLHYALLALQYTAVVITFITLLLRIVSISFAYEINKKFDEVSKSLSFKGISNFIQGIRNDVIPSTNTFEHTIPYFLSLVLFTVWDSIQCNNADKIYSRNKWFFFYPTPCIAPITIGVSFGLSILLFIWYCTPLNNCRDSEERTPGDDKKKKTWDFCRLHDIVNFPILTGLSVFFVFHGSWMLIMFAAYPNLVIIRSLFLLPLFFFIITLLPRSIKGLCNWYYEFKICKKCKKCKCKTCRKPNINILTDTGTLTTLSSTITKLSGAITILNNTLNGSICTGNLTTLNTAITTLSDNINTLNDKIKNHQAIPNETITTLSDAITKLNTTLSAPSGSSGSAGALTTLSDTITALCGDITKNNFNGPGALTTLSDTITTLSDTITILQTTLTGSNEISLKILSDNIKKLNTKLTDTTTKLDNLSTHSDSADVTLSKTIIKLSVAITTLITTLNGTITTLKNTITTLDDTLKTTLSGSTGTLTTLNTNITRLSDAITEFNNTLTGSKLSENVITLRMTITTLHTHKAIIKNQENEIQCESCKNISEDGFLGNCGFWNKCFLCKFLSKLKLCEKCKTEKGESIKNFTTIYGFSVTLAIALPLLFVLYYASDYILVVAKINENPLTLLLTLVLILGVPYYLILLWDNDIPDIKDTKTNKKATEVEPKNLQRDNP